MIGKGPARVPLPGQAARDIRLQRNKNVRNPSSRRRCCFAPSGVEYPTFAILSLECALSVMANSRIC